MDSKVTNDVIMMYHVMDEVSLFPLKERERNQYRGTAPPPLERPGKGWGPAGGDLAESKNADSTFSLTVMHASTPPSS